MPTPPRCRYRSVKPAEAPESDRARVAQAAVRRGGGPGRCGCRECDYHVAVTPVAARPPAWCARRGFEIIVAMDASHCPRAFASEHASSVINRCGELSLKLSLGGAKTGLPGPTPANPIRDRNRLSGIPATNRDLVRNGAWRPWLAGDVYNRDGNGCGTSACMSIWRLGHATSSTCVYCKTRQKGFE